MKEHCGNCVNARTAGVHVTCGTDPKIGFLRWDGGVCLCVNVADSTKPTNCPGWVAVAKLTKTTEATR